MHNAVQQILNSIPQNHIFDSHFIINQLIKNYSDVYLQFTAQFTKSSQVTVSAHGQIGQVISSFNGSLVQQFEEKSWSENIHGNVSECTCWQKI